MFSVTRFYSLVCSTLLPFVSLDSFNSYSTGVYWPSTWHVLPKRAEKKKPNSHRREKKIMLSKWQHNCFYLFIFSRSCIPITVICCPHVVLLTFLLFLSLDPSSICLVSHLLRLLSLDICCNSHLISCLFIWLPDCLHISLLSLRFFVSFLCPQPCYLLTSPNIYLLSLLAPVSFLPLPCHPPLPLLSWYLLWLIFNLLFVHLSLSVCLLFFLIFSISHFPCCFHFYPQQHCHFSSTSTVIHGFSFLLTFTSDDTFNLWVCLIPVPFFYPLFMGFPF